MLFCILLNVTMIQNFVGATISQKTIEQPIVCACLLVVEIECGEVDHGVRKFLKILSICGILEKQISINNRQLHWDRKPPFSYLVSIINYIVLYDTPSYMF